MKHAHCNLEALEGRTLLSAGSLDASFGEDGKVITSASTTIGFEDAVVLSDQSTIAAVNSGVLADTRIRLMKFDENGAPDTTFGSSGLATADFGSGKMSVHRLLVQGDGKILAIGQKATADTSQCAVARFNADGSIDTTFAGGGLFAIDIGNDGGLDLATDGVQLSNGQVIVGCSVNATSAALLRLNTNGTLDTAFGSNGAAIANVQMTTPRIALTADNKIVAASSGQKDIKLGTNLARFTSAGILDSGFSGDGLVFIESFSTGAIFVTAQNKIIDVGYDGVGNVVVHRFIPGGGADTTLSPDGSIAFASASGNVVVSDAALQPDGKIVFAGSVGDAGQPTNFLIGRLTPELLLDVQFGTDGLLQTTFSGFDAASSVAVSNGKIVAAGSTFTNASSNDDAGAIARYFTTESTATLIGSDWLINGTGGKDKIRLEFVNNVANVIITGPENFTAIAPDGVERIVISGGLGNDRITNVDVSRPCIINGNAGNDTIFGGDGDDLLIGSNGNDRLDGGLGGDTLVGAAGRDTVTYEFRTAPVFAGIGEIKGGSGEGGEGDLISNSVETLIGGSGNDRLSGARLRVVLYGGAGDDNLVGSAGDDAIFGNDGKDRLIGGAGADTLDGGAGMDRATDDPSDLRISIELLLN